MKIFLLSILFVGFLINANSQTLLVENFNYTSTGSSAADSINNLTGSIWVRHSGTGGQVMWSPTGLTYTGYSGSNIGGSVSAGHGSGSRADYNAAVDSIKTGDVYFSFLINVTATGGTTADYLLHFAAANGAAPGSDFKARFFIKDTLTGSVRFGLSKGGAAATAVWTAGSYTVAQTYLMVMKYSFNPAATNDDFCSLYVFSTGVPSTEPTSADIVTSDVATDIAKVNSICIRQSTTGTANAILDGIRVGTAWNFAPLPIKLTNFNAIGLKNIVNVSWLSHVDQSGGSFIVERSVDGSVFENIYNTPANNLGNANFEMTDRNLPAVKTLYYRLKIINSDGRFEYSNVQKVQLKDVKVSVSPNPASNEILINASETINSVELYDITGRRIMVKENINQNQVRLQITSVKEGTYIVKSNIGGEINTTQILVKH